MCGSGTLVCEALMSYCHVPSGFGKYGAGLGSGGGHFGFERLPDFQPTVWKTLRREIDGGIRDLPKGLIGGSDISGDAVAAARANTSVLPGGKSILLKKNKFQDLPALSNTIVVCNPPYGLRIEKTGAGTLIKQFGDFLKNRCQGCEAYLYLGKRELVKQVGLRSSWKKPLKSGGLDGRVVKYELY
jgi:putative N6-adenine-specific DNA methylase